MNGETFKGRYTTTPAAVIANKNKTDTLKAVDILMRKEMGHIAVSTISSKLYQ